MTVATQACAPQPRARICPTSHSTSQPSSEPPKHAGWQIRRKPAASKSAMVSSGQRRAASQAWLRSRSTGTSASARRNISSRVIVVVPRSGMGGTLASARYVPQSMHGSAGKLDLIRLPPGLLLDAILHAAELFDLAADGLAV